MLAHYHYEPDYVLYQTTLGRTLALFDCALAWVKLTSPFGGDESGAGGSEPVRKKIDADEPGAFPLLGPMASHAVVVDADHLDADIRDLISPDYRIQGERR